jgi:hypothetical protein
MSKSLSEVKEGQACELGCGRDEQVRDRRGAVVALVTSSSCTSSARSSIAGVRYSTGIIEIGGIPDTERASAAVRAD